MKTKQKTKAPKMINGKMMRYCVVYNVWVNMEGTYAYREYNDPSKNCSLIIHIKADGSKYLNTKSHGEILLDEAVAICFRPMPKDGKKYILIHKDGNLGNCNAYNLEWKQVPKYSPTDKERELDNGLVVRINGEILDRRKVLPLVKESGDGDTNRIVAIEPKVCYRRKNQWGVSDDKSAFIDDLMAAAEFVDGDPSLLVRPRVLHKNMDYLDFHADNLEWVEENSVEYQEYMKRKKEDKDNLTVKLNPGHPNPLMLPRN